MLRDTVLRSHLGQVRRMIPEVDTSEKGAGPASQAPSRSPPAATPSRRGHSHRPHGSVQVGNGRSGEWHDLGASDSAIARQEGNVMNDARRRDQLVRRVGLEVELGRLKTDGQINRPDVEAG